MASAVSVSPRADAALVASVPVTALGRNRVRQSAKRLLSLALNTLASRDFSRTRPSEVQEFRGLCRTLLMSGKLAEQDASKLQQYAAMIHEDLCRNDVRI